MAKEQSFSAKVAKAAGGVQGNHCPKCGELLSAVKLIVSKKSEARNSWKFNEKLVMVCQCNQTEVYG